MFAAPLEDDVGLDLVGVTGVCGGLAARSDRSGSFGWDLLSRAGDDSFGLGRSVSRSHDSQQRRVCRIEAHRHSERDWTSIARCTTQTPASSAKSDASSHAQARFDKPGAELSGCLRACAPQWTAGGRGDAMGPVSSKGSPHGGVDSHELRRNLGWRTAPI